MKQLRKGQRHAGEWQSQPLDRLIMRLHSSWFLICETHIGILTRAATVQKRNIPPAGPLPSMIWHQDYQRGMQRSASSNHWRHLCRKCLVFGIALPNQSTKIYTRSASVHTNCGTAKAHRRSWVRISSHLALSGNIYWHQNAEKTRRGGYHPIKNNCGKQ